MDESTEQFNSKNFDPDKFVKEISHGCVGSIELHQERTRIQNLADETSNILKRNVYRNYNLFIEAAKEVSRLEGDMYQLSHLLSEQRSLLTTLAGTSVFEDEERLLTTETKTNKDDNNDDIIRRQALSDIAEKVEGCINLSDNSGRYYLYQGDLIELDAIDNSQICKLYVYLLSDVLLLTSIITSRRTPARYKLETIYDVGNLAVVNVKDVKNSFKLLAFPDTRVFQASNSLAKKEWMEKFEEAKKLHMSEQSRKRNSISLEQKSSPARINSIESSTNPFDEVEDESNDTEVLPDWLLEVAEDLDVLIVERHFEDAFSLIEKAKTFLKESPPSNDILVQDLLGKMEVRVKTLTQILTKELEITPGKSHQGGLRAARRSVRLLNTLQKSTQACDLFLKLCSNLLKTHVKRVKCETSTTLYVKQLSAVFFLNLCDMAKEFQYQAFPNNPYCASSFVVWCTKEVSNFLSQLIRQVFIPQVSLAVLKKCVEYLHYYSNQLTEFGLDVTYQIGGQLRSPLTRILLETRDKLLESIQSKTADEKWCPMNLKSKPQVNKLLSEFHNAKIPGVEKYVKDCIVELTEVTIWFCQTFAQFIENSSFDIPNIAHDVEQAICDVLLRFVEHIIRALFNQKYREPEKIVIEKNAKFLAEDFIPFCDMVYEKHYSIVSVKFRQIRNEFNDSLNENTITG